MEERETMWENKRTISHKTNESRAGAGKRPIITPKLVATPFPPLPLRKIEKICPVIARSPVMIETNELKCRKPLEM